jgi:aryl-alcohol dehydrogenase-like predicted oxidoreductase
MPVLAYSSLARGLFSGRVTSFCRRELEATLDGASLTAYCHEPNFRRLERARALARERSATVPQIALAYALTSSLNVFPIVGAASGAEFRENAAALKIELSDRERLWLDLRADEV